MWYASMQEFSYDNMQYAIMQKYKAGMQYALSERHQQASM